ncbi:MAG: hypothetical protein Q8M94_09915 [Ignavibacteria bacterium]|nr:hypothetical protein [Ignavibacteria bacterium]
MQKLKVSQVAKMIGISVATVYRKINSCETVKNHLIKEKGCLFLNEEGFEILKKSFQKEEPPTTNDEAEYLKKIIDQQQGTIQELIARQAEERQRSDTIIMKLSNDLGSVRNLLEEAKKPIALLNELPKPVPIWKPEKPKDPMEGMAWYQRAWVGVFEPWKMRKYAS